MGTIQSGLRAIFEDEERGVTTPEAVVGAVAARIRRGRAGRIAGVSAGTLTLAGFAAAVPFALSHLDSPELAPGATPGNPLGLSCGDPVPSSLISSPDRGEFNVYELAVEINLESGASVLYYPLPSPSAPAEAQVHGFFEARFSGVIVARDGAVVGWTDPALSPGAMTLTSEGLDEPGGEVTTIVMTSAGIIWCPEAGGQAEVDGVPAVGSYLTYPYIDPNSP
jgi:hypothetical protein